MAERYLKKCRTQWGFIFGHDIVEQLEPQSEPTWIRGDRFTYGQSILSGPGCCMTAKTVSDQVLNDELATSRPERKLRTSRLRFRRQKRP